MANYTALVARARGEREKENSFLSPPLALTSPFACCSRVISRVTSRDSSKGELAHGLT